jgi:hypothetical protein
LLTESTGYTGVAFGLTASDGLAWAYRRYLSRSLPMLSGHQPQRSPAIEARLADAELLEAS